MRNHFRAAKYHMNQAIENLREARKLADEEANLSTNALEMNDTCAGEHRCANEVAASLAAWVEDLLRELVGRMPP